MSISKRAAALTGFIATLVTALVLLAATDGASARNQTRASVSSTHSQNTIHSIVAKNDHGHRHHRRELRLSRLVERPVYCDCSYESCPEWIIVQCVGYQRRHADVRRAQPAPRCICSSSDLMDPYYD
jgi:hypothetical protein